MPGFFRIVFFALAFYILYKIIRFFQSLNKASTAPPKPKSLSGVMVKDEICNTYLPKEDAIKEIHRGKEHYFCSPECRRKFLEAKKKRAA
jgi:YHS domain-containing protein